MTDKSLEDWTVWMDAQLEERFPNQRPKQLVATTLNFSRNSLGNDGMQSLVEYLRGREIGVQTLKLFRNSIGDDGAWAIGKLLAHATVPVHEVHLSHNVMTEQGAYSVLESIARCGRYPYPADHAGRKDQRGHAPVWLRMEHNCVNWSAIEHRLEQRQLRWCAADSRDGWHPKERAPMVCLHNSFRNQTAEQLPRACWGSSAEGDEDTWKQDCGREDGQLLLALLQGPDGAARKSLDTQQMNGATRGTASPPAQAAAEVAVHTTVATSAGEDGSEQSTAAEEDNVPLYVFLDAGAVVMMLSGEGLFTFQGLLNLCHQGHMKCTPPHQDRRPLKPRVGPVEERECIMLVLTDAVLETLAEMGDRDRAIRRRLEALKSEPGGYLNLCLEWGIVEIIETVLHTQLMRFTPEHERLAHEKGISRQGLKMLDFVSLWESQIMTEGRVLFVTSDESFCRFSSEARSLGCTEICPPVCPPVVHYEELNRLFAEDTVHGGRQLCEAAQHRQAPRCCGALLSAMLLATVAGLAGEAAPPVPAESEAAQAAGTAGKAEVSEALRAELQRALELVAEARRLFCHDSCAGAGDAAEDKDTDEANWARQTDAAVERWRALLKREG